MRRKELCAVALEIRESLEPPLGGQGKNRMSLRILLF